MDSYHLRHALSIGFILFIAVGINDLYSFSHEYWMALAAFFVTHTTRGTPFRQGLTVFTIMLAALLISLVLKSYVPLFLQFYLIVALFIVLVFWLRNRLDGRSEYLLVVFLTVFLTSVLNTTPSMLLMQERMTDVLLGALIGIVGMQVLIFSQPAKEFRLGLIPFYNALIAYSQALCSALLHSQITNDVLAKKIQVERSLQSGASTYPEWVFEAGFNPGLRAGFRFFLLHSERIAELFFAMNGLLSCYPQVLNVAEMKLLNHALAQSMQKNQELLLILANYLQKDEIGKITSNFTSDMTTLEEALHQVAPNQLELLDISPNYIALTALVRDIKDMRGILLQLIMALPNPSPSTPKH